MAQMDVGLGVEAPPRRNIWDVFQGIGQGLPDTANPHIPGGASFIGSALKSFGDSRAAQASLERRNSLEQRLGVPPEFFLRLSKEAQQDILDRKGFAGQSPLDMPIPELGGQTWRKASELGLEGPSGRTIPLSLLPKENVGQYLPKVFPGLASTVTPREEAQTIGTIGQEARAQGKYPYEIQRLMEDISGASARNDASAALAAWRRFKTQEAIALSEAQPVPQSVLDAARMQGFTQFGPGTQITWKEYRAITRNNAALNAFADALQQAVGAIIASGTVDERAVDAAADAAAKHLRGTISNDAVDQLKKSIKDQWRAMKGMVSGGVGTPAPLPWKTDNPLGGGEEDQGGGKGGLYP